MRNKRIVKELIDIENIVESGLDKLYNKNTEGIFYNEKFNKSFKELENNNRRSKKEIKVIEKYRNETANNNR